MSPEEESRRLSPEVAFLTVDWPKLLTPSKHQSFLAHLPEGSLLHVALWKKSSVLVFLELLFGWVTCYIKIFLIIKFTHKVLPHKIQKHFCYLAFNFSLSQKFCYPFWFSKLLLGSYPFWLVSVDSCEVCECVCVCVCKDDKFPWERSG